MNVDVLTETLIRRTPDDVATFVMNPKNAPLWYVNIKAAEWKSDPPLRVGSLITFGAEFLGKRLVYTYQILELIPGHKLVMSTAEGPFTMTTEYVFAPTAEGDTRMTLRNYGSPSGFGALMAPFMSGAMRRANTKDLALLKKILESASPRP